MNLRRMLRLWALAIVVSLGGCGGGGGGPSNVAGPAATLNGNVSYDAVPNPHGALDYNATASKPVRGAGVDIVEAATGRLLASTSTDDNGFYSASVPTQLLVNVRVRAQLARSGQGPSWDVTVRDNTQSDALYAMESPSFQMANGMTRDLHASSGWGGAGYIGDRVAGPFAILDTVYTAMKKVLSVAPNSAFPPLQMFWSVNNVPSPGLVSRGQIGTTSFVAGPTGFSINVLGKENVDTDEYDASVIAHEWGHYYQHAFSRDDSPGGNHDFDSLLDQRLAFSEGWGNAWSGIALDRQNYTDSTRAAQSVGIDVDLSAGASAPAGWYREDSVQSILWRLNQRFGFAGIHNAMTSAFRTTPAVTSIHAFAAAYASVMPAAQGELSSLLVGQSISGVVNDPWATQETNNGGVAQATPIYKAAVARTPSTACVTNVAGSDNKLGAFAYLRLTVPSAGNYQITVSGPANADPDFAVYAGSRLAASESPGASESAVVGLPAGEVVLAVNDANNSSSNTCFNIQIQ